MDNQKKAGWAFITALIHPISGEPGWDFFERTANWAASLCLDGGLENG